MITNNGDISLEMAVWLLHDDYDFINEENYISATGLMKPIRHILLPTRVPLDQRVATDVEDLIPSALGKTIHAGIEKAWENGKYELALKKLGVPAQVINRVLVNPTPEQLAAVENPIAVYIEQRAFREIDGYKIGGKFDLVCEGRVTDTKSTSVWAWIKGGRDEDYRLQGSIYRWLNPDKITEDYIRINFVFTDWASKDSKTIANYPPRRLMHKDIELMSLEETEAWIRTKLAQVTKHSRTPESELPECTPQELWMSEPKYRYYADPAKALVPGARSSKNFDTLTEANAFVSEKGKGTVITVPGAPKRCGYCPAFPICTQKDKYTHD